VVDPYDDHPMDLRTMTDSSLRFEITIGKDDRLPRQARDKRSKDTTSIQQCNVM